MPTYQQVYNEQLEKLKDADTTVQAILLLLNSYCNDANINLYANFSQPINKNIEELFTKGCARLATGEPLDYILGYTPFYGYNFNVDNRVLIPRPETEELVAYALSLIDEKFTDFDKVKVADIGCGSGAIGMAVALEESKVELYSSDISNEALQVAKENAEKFGLNVQFFQGDMAKPFIANNIKVDLLLCNPPYIPVNEKMERSVVDYEPHVALFGGEDGLKFYRSVLNDAYDLLQGKGYACFEMGYNQKEALTQLVKSIDANADVKVIKDINQKNRILVVEFNYGNR